MALLFGSEDLTPCRAGSVGGIVVVIVAVAAAAAAAAADTVMVVYVYRWLLVLEGRE